MKLKWMDHVTSHNLARAQRYLTLRYGEEIAQALMSKLRNGPLQAQEASDILRTVGRQPLPLNDGGVQNHLQEAKQGHPMEPVLLVQTPYGNDIANGYHTTSLAFHLGVRTLIPCVIASLDPRAS